MSEKIMAHNVLLFASLKERIGARQISVQACETVVLNEFLKTLLVQFPQLEPFSNNLVVSINQEFASADQVIYPNDEIALFPPVSGG
ncbi:MAG TPA: MoaD/ThiS family protein [Leptolinea sp.]